MAGRLETGQAEEQRSRREMKSPAFVLCIVACSVHSVCITALWLVCHTTCLRDVGDTLMVTT